MPRRFPMVNKYDWGKNIEQNANATSKKGVIVDMNDNAGWIVIDKPAGIPTHMTVDNQVENVATALFKARQDSHGIVQDIYVSTPQRLDQNTSGLLVVSTSKIFAAYYAQLLRHKTEQLLQSENETTNIQKAYRCLVCLMPPPPDPGLEWSVAKAVNALCAMAESGTVVRHYLKPSIRAPKHFAVQADDSESWLECLLRIKSTGSVHALVGSDAAEYLARRLWNEGGTLGAAQSRRPKACQAVLELEIELLTGRTHQIRGQLAAMGYPIVGDAQYGGAIPSAVQSTERQKQHSYYGMEMLALQCHELAFVEPDIVSHANRTTALHRSSRWASFNLDAAWWTTVLAKYGIMSEGDPTSTLTSTDVRSIVASTRTDRGERTRSDLLPPRVSLSPGRHKYVLIKATSEYDDQAHWFVKSASKEECGGPYHGNVAQDLRVWITAAGYNATVTGGGRIWYDKDAERAVVYGFSYGFGKGDHEKAAGVIRKWSKGPIDATFDNRDGLY